MTIVLTLDEKIEQELQEEAFRQGLTVAAYTAKIIEQHVGTSRRTSTALELLESWLNDDAEEQKETGETLTHRLDEDRLSARPLFPPATKGLTW
jgi:hypothetical protein